MWVGFEGEGMISGIYRYQSKCFSEQEFCRKFGNLLTHVFVKIAIRENDLSAFYLLLL